jgi:iron complex outermembrane receptor protein
MNREQHNVRRGGILVMAFLLIMGTAQAQTVVSISGTVSDEHGEKIPGAIVHFRSRAGLQLNTTSDETGTFAFPRISTGSYFLEVQAQGFALYSSTVQASAKTTEIAVVLKLAAVNATVTVTGTGTPQTAEEVAKVVSVLDANQIESRNVLSLTETLRSVPGIRIQQQGSTGSLATVRLRGQRTFDTALLLDGLRVRDASDINGSAVSLFSDLAPISLERIEILRGSGSSIYGTNAVGGVINLVPSTGVGPLRLEAGFEGGTLRTFREHLKASGGAGEIGYSLGVERTDVRHGIDGSDEYGNTVGVGRFQLQPRDDIAVGFNFYATIANSRINDSPFALPAAFTSSETFPKAIPGLTFQSDIDNPDQGRRNRLLVGSARVTHHLNQSLSYSVAYQRVSSSRRNYNGPAIDPQFQSLYPFGDFEFINVNGGVIDTLDARMNAIIGRSNLITIGFEVEGESLFQQSIPSFSAFNNTTDRQRTFALFGQDQLSLLQNRLQISLAMRGQFFRLRAADRPGFLSGIDPERSLTGDGAISYFFPSTSTKLRVHAGNGFRAPSLYERFGAGTFAGAGLTRFGDPTLRAEQSISVDGGIDQRLVNDRVLLGVTYFYTRLQRVIGFESFVADPLGLGRFSGYVNEPGGLSRGVESFIELTPARGTELRSSYTYSNSDRTSSTRGLLPEYVVPKHLFEISLNQRYRGFVFHLNLNRIGAYLAPVFENNPPFRIAELSFPGYTKVDLFGSYERRLGEDVGAVFFVAAENVLNRSYYENGFRAPGFLARGGIKLKF